VVESGDGEEGKKRKEDSLLSKELNALSTLLLVVGCNTVVHQLLTLTAITPNEVSVATHNYPGLD
jgi:hypothetical protein